MKIGIVTQPLRYNYGGLLQNYALQTVLRKMGHEPVTLDYQWSLGFWGFVKSTLKTMALLMLPGRRRKFAVYHPRREKKVFDDFIGTHISRTDYLYSYRNSTVKRLGLYAVITGSDQVWRPIFNDNLSDMYLGFIKGEKVKRIAYAASYGISEQEYTPAEIATCRAAACRLHAVSVRERSGIDLFKAYFGGTAIEVLDPTLLLSGSDYEDLIDESKSDGRRMLCAYILDGASISDDELQKIAHEARLDGVYRMAEGEDLISPGQWLSMLKNAALIVTDSFHGTVFSILFRKRFVSICNGWRGADRLNSLLSGLGLSERIVNVKKDDIHDVANREIRWDDVESFLKLRREISLEFLRSSLR